MSYNQTENNKNINNNKNNNININIKPNPILYRDFIISDNVKQNIKKVDMFYMSNIDNFDKTKNVNINNNIYKRYKDFSVEKLFVIMDNLIQNKELYEICENNCNYVTEETSFENSIVNFTKNIYCLIFKKLLDNFENEVLVKDIIKNGENIFANIVKYNKILKSPLFSEIFKRFIIVLKNKCIEFSSKHGLISTWLTFADICPEMIKTDCYLWLNYQSTEFKFNNMDFIKNNFLIYQIYESYFDKNKHMNFNNTDYNRDCDYYGNYYECNCDSCYYYGGNDHAHDYDVNNYDPKCNYDYSCNCYYDNKN